MQQCLAKGIALVMGTIGLTAAQRDVISAAAKRIPVIYGTFGETITLNHTAHNRDTFVRGALRAAEWLVGRSPGRYSMADVLGIE